MPKYLIEREIPGAVDLSPRELQGTSQSGFPANRISQISSVIDSTTSE